MSPNCWLAVHPGYVVNFKSRLLSVLLSRPRHESRTGPTDDYLQTICSCHCEWKGMFRWGAPCFSAHQRRKQARRWWKDEPREGLVWRGVVSALKLNFTVNLMLEISWAEIRLASTRKEVTICNTSEAAASVFCLIWVATLTTKCNLRRWRFFFNKIDFCLFELSFWVSGSKTI